MKKCYSCQKEKSLEEFFRDKSRQDGRQYICKQCRKIKRPKRSAVSRLTDAKYRKTERYRLSQKKYKKSTKGKAANARQVRKYRKSHRDYFLAVQAVHKAVKQGTIPKPTSRKCFVCNRKARQYHHFRGYAKDYRLDVVPVCVRCHRLIHRPSS